MKVAQDRQKQWPDVCRRNLEFEVGDHVLQKISPTRGVIRFRNKGKLTQRFVGPFDIVEHVGPMVYRLSLPLMLAGVHDVFHISQLRKYVQDEGHILDFSQLRPDLSYEGRPISIWEKQEKVMKNRTISLVREAWSRNSPKDSTWDHEEEVREKYLYLLP